jgi:hypothetical protein
MPALMRTMIDEYGVPAYRVARAIAILEGGRPGCLRAAADALQEEDIDVLYASLLAGASAGVGEPGRAVNPVPRADQVRVLGRP